MHRILPVALVLLAMALPALGSTVRMNVIYRVADGIPLLLDLYLPDGDGPHPGILFIHGGAWHTGDKLSFYSYARYFADRGYVCQSIDYRLAPFFTFPAQLEDVRSALNWLGEHAAEYGVDMARVAAVGDSAGGHLAALLALAPAPLGGAAGRVAAVVSLYGPMDLTLYTADPAGASVVADFLGAPYEEAPELWREASPISWVTPDAPPFLLIHGEADGVVPVEHSLAMAQALEEVGAEVELLLIPGAGHEFHLVPYGWANLLARARMEGFLARVISSSPEGTKGSS